jgi:hypothetical protein
MTFFKKEILEKIYENLSPPTEMDNFLDNNEIKILLEYMNSLKDNMVDREESTKISFNFNDHKILKDIEIKVKKIIGEFYVNDFKPHFHVSRFPLRIHADTGKNPNDIIFKNIVIPLKINSKNNSPVHSIVFKNKWFNQSALFTTKSDQDYDYIIKDIDGNFQDIIDIRDFLKVLNDTVDGEKINYKGGNYIKDNKFFNYIMSLSKGKRYNLRTNKHIQNDNKFDKKLYDQYMSHQPYEDLKGMEVEKIFNWKPGKLFTWDRVQIHSSDNFLKENNLESKTFIAFFTSKNKIV